MGKLDEIQRLRQQRFAEAGRRKMAEPPAPPEPVTHQAVSNIPSPNASPNMSPNSGVARNLRWRAKNRDRYNAGMRELMRKRRAAARASATAIEVTP
jgi:hypothetical protein